MIATNPKPREVSLKRVKHPFEIRLLTSKRLKELCWWFKKSTICCDEVAMMASLSTISGLLDNAVRIAYNPNNPSTNALSLYWLFVGPSMIARKSYTMSTVLNLVRAVNDKVMSTSNFTFEGLFDSLYKRTSRSAILQTDEFRSVLGNSPEYAKTLVDDITAGYNGSNWSRTLVRYGAKSKKVDEDPDNTRKIDSYQLTYCAATTPDWFYSYISNDTFTGGFLNRFIVTTESKNSETCRIDLDDACAVKRFTDDIPDIDYDNILKFLNEYRDFMRREIGCGRIIIGEQAQQVISLWKKDIRARYSHCEGGGDEISIQEAIISRSAENAKRMACLIDLYAGRFDREKSLFGTNLVCSLESMEAALLFMNTAVEKWLQAVDKNYSDNALDAKIKSFFKAVETYYKSHPKLAFKDKKTGKRYLAISRSEAVHLSHLSGRLKDEFFDNMVETGRMVPEKIMASDSDNKHLRGNSKKTPTYYWFPEKEIITYELA